MNIVIPKANTHGAIGYLEDDGENHKIFSAIAKALKNGGKHFISLK